MKAIVLLDGAGNKVVPRVVGRPLASGAVDLRALRILAVHSLLIAIQKRRLVVEFAS